MSAFHFYDPPQLATRASSYISRRIADARHLGVALFLTETGGGAGGGYGNWSYFEAVAPASEDAGVSWAHFGWKTFCREWQTGEQTPTPQLQRAQFGACKTGVGTGPWTHGGKRPDAMLDEALLLRLARPYASAIAGVLNGSSFSGEERTLRVSFDLEPQIDAPTLLSLPELVYPRGVHIKVAPAGALHLGTRGEKGRVARGGGWGGLSSGIVDPLEVVGAGVVAFHASPALRSTTRVVITVTPANQLTPLTPSRAPKAQRRVLAPFSRLGAFAVASYVSDG